MQINKPDYYDEFNCIASACDFTCCQDWTIAVDEKTYEKWQKRKAPSAQKEDSYLAAFTQCQADNHSIRLSSDGKCPFLNETGLCTLVLEYGESCLSNTCHTFPRETHEYTSRVEYALSLGCKNVLEHMWAKDDFRVISIEVPQKAAESGMDIASVSVTGHGTEQVADDTPEVLFMIRDWLIEIASDRTVSVSKAIKMLFYLVLDLYETEQKDSLTAESFLVYRESNILNQVKTAIQDAECISVDTFLEDNELFLDIAENYRKKKIYTKYLNPVALQAEQYEKKSALRGLEYRIERYSQIWDGFEHKMRTLICEELYASSLLPGSTMFHMVMKLEWLAIEYAVIRQWMFLKWDKEDVLTDDDLMTAVSVIFRMTGYSDDDIEEYLENSFQSVIWDWGYLALIV